MKIGFDAKRLYNNFTGLGNYSRTLVGNLIREFGEDEYYLYTTKYKHSTETQYFLKDKRLPTKKYLFDSMWRSFGCIKDMQRDGIDLFHGLSHEIPFGINKTNIKSIVTIHDIIYKTFPKMYSPIDRKIYDAKFRYACDKSDVIIAISESTKNDIIRFYNTDAAKIKVIHQAINPIFYNDNTNTDIKHLGLPNEYLLYVGSINSRKNLLNIVKAYQYINTSDRIPLVVVGNGRGYKKEVLKYIYENNIEKYIIFFDSIEDTKVLKQIYKNALVFIYPSFYEGFGLPVTEALLSGLPTITSNTSSLPEAGGDAAYYINPHKAEEIAEAIKLLCTDTNERETRIKQGIKYAKTMFNPQKLTHEVHNLYKSII